MVAASTALPPDRMAGLTALRAAGSSAITQARAARRRASLPTPDGRLLIVAADHPARGALGVRDVDTAMASRRDLLGRLVTALGRPGVDGVLATPDVIDDLLLLGALEGKVVIGSMNRGGLQGAGFELDDRFTAYSAAAIAAHGHNGGKMLARVDLADPGTASTLEACARAVNELSARGLIAMIEPFLSVRSDGRVRNLLDPDSVIKSIAIAQGLGETSEQTWLKLPVVAEMERVMEATTMPTLLLGGDPVGDAEASYAEWAQGLSLPAVRGLVVGRALLYPQDDDVATAVDTAAALVRPGPAKATGDGAG